MIRPIKKIKNEPGASDSHLSFSGGRDQEDRSLKPASANSSRDPILNKTHHKKGLVEWLKG
jgi:hypothetical protein